ncbi:DUF6957 family protein [Cellvibrio sp.]|uniref:DUF6957 family protein n=1 Tax=Cellvibrio sp. TaxID=1965322 RepID=UPI0039647BCF
MIAPMDALQGVADALYRKGTPCDFGIDDSCLPAMIELAFARYPNKAVRAVKDWAWWDLAISNESRPQYAAAGVQPAIVFSTYLIWDSREQWSEGWNVKTTVLVSFEENCMFITRNTVYILVGHGYRKTVDPQIVASLYFLR